jgi:hypothetical protein
MIDLDISPIGMSEKGSEIDGLIFKGIKTERVKNNQYNSRL